MWQTPIPDPRSPFLEPSVRGRDSDLAITRRASCEAQAVGVGGEGATIPGLAALARTLAALLESGGGAEFHTAELLGALDDESATSAAAALTAEVHTLTSGDPEQTRVQWDACLNEARRQRALTSATVEGDWKERIAGVRSAADRFGPPGRNLPRSRPGGP